MGNKYHVLHRHLSRLSRPDDLGLGVAVPSMHQLLRRGLLGNRGASGIKRSQKLSFR
jgi:hypothetical protein